MSSRSSRVTATGLAIAFVGVNAGVSFSGCGSLLGLLGVTAGASLIAAGVRAADGPAVLAGARALAAFLRRNLAVVGLVTASSAVTAVAGEAGLVPGFRIFALLLLGMITIGVLGE